MSTFVNPPFEILSTEQRSHLKDTGDDMVFWWVQVKTAEYTVPVLVDFDVVTYYCNKQHPNIGAYYSSVRKNVKGFGPKHSQMFAIMDEEGFDHLPHIYNYIKDCCDLQKYHERDLELKQTLSSHDNAQQLKAKVKSLEQHMPGMRSSTVRGIAFKDRVLDLLNIEVLERYPEIFNSDPKYITECQGILIDVILDLGSRIDSLAFHAANEKRGQQG